MITAQDLISKLTDVFAKDPESNIGKLLGIFAEQFNELEVTQEKMRQWRGIDAAEGTTLDRIGTNVVQPRGVATDGVYRVLIKSKIARNLSTADVNTIIRVLSLALDCDPSEIQINESYSNTIGPEPAAISLLSLPVARLIEVNMDPRQFVQIVQRTVAAGVKVGIIELTGTFQFASAEVTTSDPSIGFSGDAGLTGGKLGYVFAPGDVEPLPV